MVNVVTLFQKTHTKGGKKRIQFYLVTNLKYQRFKNECAAVAIIQLLF